MSRCFPFPPPGYERKHRAEDLLELKEVKRKEKKDKKEKRRKDREKKDKDGNSEKRGDKKDRKEKHREKKEKNRHKKDENREKEEEKTRNLQDSTFVRKPKERNDKELHLEGHGYDGSSYTGVNKSSLSHSLIGAKPLSYGASQTTPEAKFLEELNKRIEEDGEISEDKFCGRGAIMEKGRQEEKTETAVLRNHSMELVGEKGRHKGEFRNMASQLPRDESTRKPVMAQNHVELSGGEVEGIPRAVELQNFRKSVDKHKSNKADGDKRREELGDRHMKIHGKDKDKRNDRKMEENSSIKSRKHELVTSKNARITYSSDATSSSHKDGCFFLGVEDAAHSEGNIRKRKDINSNGFLHDSEVRPYKIQVQTFHHFPENGKKPVASEVFIKTSSDNVAIPETIQFHDSSLSMKATVQPLKVSHSKNNASVDVMGKSRISVDPKGPYHDSGSANDGLNVPTVEDLLAEASRRPPHPDSKYLSQILRVPDTGQWSECDDQEWLFTKKDPPLEKSAQESTMGRHMYGRRRYTSNQLTYMLYLM